MKDTERVTAINGLAAMRIRSMHHRAGPIVRAEFRRGERGSESIIHDYVY
jgi:hypothetical protein